jgi:hypothetical protein
MTPSIRIQSQQRTKNDAGAPPRDKYPFYSCLQIAFTAFLWGDGRTSERRGSRDYCGLSNMGCSAIRGHLRNSIPNSSTNLVALKGRTIRARSNIGGLKTESCHRFGKNMPFVHRQGEQCVVGIDEDLPIDTLFGLGFQGTAKMEIELRQQRSISLLQQHFDMRSGTSVVRTNKVGRKQHT